MGKKPDIQLVTVKESMITEDWKNREFLRTITDKIDKMVKILAMFELNCKTKLRMFEERIIHAEKMIEYLESQFEEIDDSTAAAKIKDENSTKVEDSALPPPPPVDNDLAAIPLNLDTAVENADETLPDFEQFPIPPEEFLN